MVPSDFGLLVEHRTVGHVSIESNFLRPRSTDQRIFTAWKNTATSKSLLGSSSTSESIDAISLEISF